MTQLSNKHIERAKRDAAKLWHRIERADDAGNVRRAKGLTKFYLKSYGAGQTAAGKDKHPHSAAKLNPWRDTAVPIKAWYDPKSDGGTRQISAFSKRDRANQVLVRTALAASAKIEPTQFAVQNGGREKAVEAIKANLLAGKTWIIKLDIRGCFDAYNHAGVKSLLPLPGRVTENVILANQEIWESVNCDMLQKSAGKGKASTRRQRGSSRNRRHHYLGKHNQKSGERNIQTGDPQPRKGRDDSDTQSLSSAHTRPYAHRSYCYHGRCFIGAKESADSRQPPAPAQQGKGVWQGSRISPLVSEIIIGHILRSLPEGACVVVFSDDILVMASSEAAVRALAQTLRRAFNSNLAGPMKLKIDEPVSAESGFDFVGYDFILKRGVVRISANLKNRRKIENRLEPLLDNFLDNALSAEEANTKIDIIIECVDNWARGFRSWPYALYFAENLVGDYLKVWPDDIGMILIDYLDIEYRRAA